jgi:hypothetical protein
MPRRCRDDDEDEEVDEEVELSFDDDDDEVAEPSLAGELSLVEDDEPFDDAVSDAAALRLSVR